jgi:hypothetical protein
MKKITVIIIVTCLSSSLYSQQTIDKKTETPVYEDTENETSIQWPNGNAFRVNTKDASAKLVFSKTVNQRKSHPLIWGLDLSGKTNDGALSLFSEGRFTPGFQANGTIGWYINYDRVTPGKDTTRNISWITFKAGYEGSKLKLINTDTSFDQMIEKKTFGGGGFSLSYNVICGNNLLFGLSAGYYRKNNYGSLDEIELSQTQTFVDTTSGITRTTEEKIAGKTGTYKTFNQFRVQGDVFIIPVQHLGLHGYARYRLNGESDSNVSLGVGAYLLRDSALSSRAGIVLGFDDITHTKSASESATVSLIVGFSFGQ